MAETRDHDNGSDAIHILDYGRVRDEIDNRTQLSAQLLNYGLIISAAVIGAYDKIPHEFLIFAALALNALWLMWLDHTNAIYKLAAYSELVIANRLRVRYPKVLGWEGFLREIDAGGTRASRVLYQKVLLEDVRVPKTTTITQYIRLLFGGASVAFLVAHFVEFMRPTPKDKLHVLLLIAAILLFLYALRAEYQHRRLIRTIARAIESHPATEGLHPAA